MVIAIVFALYRWDDSMSYHYIRQTFAFEDLQAILNIKSIVDWLKNGKVG